MINEFSGVGNLGVGPVLRMVDVGDENRPVVNVRVFFDRPVRQQDDSYKDQGGFWLNVSFWDNKAEQAMRLLKKGSRIFVLGQLRGSQWTDKESGELRTDVQLTAEYFFIDPIGIESIQFRSKTRLVSGTADELDP